MTTLIKIDAIKVKDRIRREVKEGELEELREDIRKNGLYHPIVVREEEGEYLLVAGGRRLEAIKALDGFMWNGERLENEVPCNLYSTLNESDALEIEIQENMMRTDLHWKVVVESRAKLHEMRVRQAEERGEKWEVSDTAKELTNLSPPNASRAISRAVVLQEHMDEPSIRNANSESRAWRQLSQKIEDEFKAKLVELKGGSRHTLHVGDVREIELEEEKFSAIICDPPYGIGSDSFSNESGKTHEYEDTPEYAAEIISCVLNEGFRWTKERAHLFLFCDIHLFPTIYSLAEGIGWDAFRTPIIWNHSSTGHVPWGADSWRRSYEILLYARKGWVKLSKTQQDIITAVKGKSDGHGAEKPVELYKRLLELSCIPGEEVLDPTCGSGTIFEASDLLGLKATGIEIDGKLAKKAQGRLL